MKNSFYMMIPNDHCFLDNDDLWVVNSSTNELCRGKLSTGKFEYVVSLPFSSDITYRQNPLCTRYKDYVICLPDKGKCIWTYDVKQKIIGKIEIDNSQSVFLGIYWCKIFGKELWAWVRGLKCLIEIDLDNMRVKNYYKISKDKDDLFAFQVINVENNIYIFSAKNKKLYEFDVVNKDINEYELNRIGEGINTVCFDNGIFWFTGFDKCVYTWNKKSGEIMLRTDFPQKFIIDRTEPISFVCQKMPFYQSVNLNKYVCFIPWNFPQTICNSVLFVNKENYQMMAVKLYNENDDGKGIYTFEYVLGDRYIGIYYSHNRFISEIDTFDFTIKEKWLNFSLDDYTRIIKHRIEMGDVLSEKNDGDLPAFIKL